jgi:hypothetical protein
MSSVYEVEEDGDEIFIPLSEVRCCRIGFNGTEPVYSKLIERTQHGHTYWCCEKCGASFGEKK